LLSSDLQDAFKHKFKAALEKRFSKDVDRLNFYPVPILVRDLPGYHLGVHTDVPDKAITVQFYLPRDASQVHLGTTFHDAAGSGPNFKEVTSMNFLPSSGYAFPVNLTASWHSVKATTEADGPRNSIMLTYYVQDTTKAWLKMRRQRFGNLIGQPPTH
jgi:hypothetical protein